MTARFKAVGILLLCVFLSQVNGESQGSEDASNKDYINITIRLGQGGFNDSRSPIGKLGGGQNTLDLKLEDFPLALSFTGEYYTNSADAEDPFEISGLTGFSLLYMDNFLPSRRLTLFGGGGAGWLEVPKGPAYPGEKETGPFYDIELGIRYRVFWKIGVYGMYKYLYARKDPFIDFSEHIVLLGICISFSL